jgi:hypothetical protein
MKPIIQFVSSFKKIFDLLGICATVGFIAGALSGLALTIFAMDLSPAPVLTATEVWQVGLLLAAFIAVFLLIFLTVICRYTFGSIFVAVILNCLLTCVLTVWLVNLTALWGWAFFVGAIVGLLIGRLLCIICQFAAYRAGA